MAKRLSVTSFFFNHSKITTNMKFLITILTASILLASCTPAKMIPLKGNYPSAPMVFTSNKSFNEVWDKLVDEFAQKGLSIKIIDRTSGLIVSGNYKLETTVEDKNGALKNPMAYIVVPKVHNAAQNRDEPINGYRLMTGSSKLSEIPVYGEWNVRIKESSGTTSININLVNINYESMQDKIPVKKTIDEGLYRSTGVFEKQFSDLIK